MDSRLLALRRASERLPAGSAFSGFTALWLHGLDVDPCDPIEATVPAGTCISTRSGMRIRRRRLEPCDLAKSRGLCAISPPATLRDMCLRLSLTESVVIADMALHQRLIATAGLERLADESSNHHGVKKLRRVLPYVEPLTESPMETRMRMLLVLNGLPRPEAQVTIRNGLFVAGRVDLFYRDARLGIEYDGASHEANLAEDNRRQNRLLEAGIRLLRFTAGDIYNSPDLALSQVRTELRRN